MPDERRTHNRWRATFYFKKDREYKRRFFDVVNTRTDESIGHLVDLTLEGMKVISRKPIERETEFDFRIVLPEEIKGSEKVVIKAQCVWCEKDVNPEFYYTGFKIISLTPPYSEIIGMLIEE